jgi:hypothetical protein
MIYSQRKAVKETTISRCVRTITVEDGSEGIEVKLNERLTDWEKSFPNTYQKVSSIPRDSLEEAEAYANELLEDTLKAGFLLAK